MSNLVTVYSYFMLLRVTNGKTPSLDALQEEVTNARHISQYTFACFMAISQFKKLSARNLTISGMWLNFNEKHAPDFPP